LPPCSGMARIPWPAGTNGPGTQARNAQEVEMDRAVVLRSISEDFLEYIQQPVRVHFDPVQQRPACFHWAGRRLMVQALVERFSLRPEEPGSGFLVEVAEHGVFFLYFQSWLMREGQVPPPACWVLGFRVLDDGELMRWNREERTLLAQTQLERLVEFHGHLCPDLVLGEQLCLLVQRLLDRFPPGSGRQPVILAENTTAALDAVQFRLGTTLGNQRLLVMDYGKHNYHLVCPSLDRCWRFSCRPLVFGDEDRRCQLEQRVHREMALLEEVLELQQLMDQRIQTLLAMAPEEIFTCMETESHPLPQAVAPVMQPCTCCGEPFLVSRGVLYQGQQYCQPCLRKLHPGHGGCDLQ
jgi:formylmethanofuran dehydrogenase subunit E